jgi:ribosomal protein S18 acetylase RimI-like enzyme
MSSHHIVRLEQLQMDEAIEILSHAFNEDPLFRYFLPEADRARANSIKQLCKTVLHYSQPYNQIYTTTRDLKGVAVWIPPGGFPFNTLRLLQAGMYARLFMLHWRRIGQFMSLFFRLEEHHKHDVQEQHWYLMMLGVAPAYQNQGIGGSLLQPILKQADSAGLPCYLETSTESGVRFYQRHGFEVVRSGELPGISPRFWTMKRQPNRIEV